MRARTDIIRSFDSVELKLVVSTCSFDSIESEFAGSIRLCIGVKESEVTTDVKKSKKELSTIDDDDDPKLEDYLE